MITANVQEPVKYRIDQAEESLDAAGLPYEKGLGRQAVNRAYYAMFYAGLALLVTLKQETSKHSGAIALFDLESVKPGILPRDFSRWLHEASDLRQRSDYTPGFKVTSGEVERILRNALSFVAEVKARLSAQLERNEGHISILLDAFLSQSASQLSRLSRLTGLL